MWTKVDDAAVLLVFACPVCGLAEPISPSEEMATNGTPFCTDCECEMDYTHACVNFSKLGEVCTDNDGQTVIYTGRHVAGRSN